MMVSISSVPFDNRPEIILDSDPHWKKFLASVAGKRSEQEAILTSQEVDVIGDGVEEENNDVNQVDDGYETDPKDEGHDEEERSDGDEMDEEDEEDEEGDGSGMSEGDGPAEVPSESIAREVIHSKHTQKLGNLAPGSIWST